MEFTSLAGRRVTVDRPLGSAHPNYPELIYPLNYGYVAGILGGDGEPQDAYILGVDQPIACFTGRIVAVVIRRDGNETKWVIAPDGAHFTKDEIARALNFQEKYFDSEIHEIPILGFSTNTCYHSTTK